MKRRLTLMLLLFAMACGSTGDMPQKAASEKNQTPATTANPEPLYCEEISNAADLKIDPNDLIETYIVDYEVREACICVVYQYSGCERARSFLSWDGHWPSEFHPVIDMQLRVLKPGMCDMLLTDSACFSIKKLSFGGDQVGVTLNEPENRLDIDFTKYQ